MKTILFVFLSTVLGSSLAKADIVLPYTNSVSEIRAILNSNEVRQTFGEGSPIEKVQRSEPGTYTVSTSKCKLEVTVGWVYKNHTKQTEIQHIGALSCAIGSGISVGNK